MRAPRLLLAVDEPPGYGGASTVAYQLHRALRKSGKSSILLLLLDPRLAYQKLLGANFANPERLPGVHVLAPESLQDLNVDVCVGLSAPAAVALKRAMPSTPCVFRSPGLAQTHFWRKALAEPSAASLERLLGRFPGLRLPTFGVEARALTSCDYVLTPSPMIRDFYARLFPRQQGKLARQPFWKASLQQDEIAAELARPFAERDVNLLFSASSWARWEKNFNLIPAILKRLPQRSVHLVGELQPRQRKLLGERVQLHGHLDRRSHYALLGRTRCLASPSCFDAAPGLLFEAAAMGCNLVASRNCGNFEVCPPELICELSADAFAQAIASAQEAAFPARLAPFYAFDPVQELWEIAEALA